MIKLRDLIFLVFIASSRQDCPCYEMTHFKCQICFCPDTKQLTCTQKILDQNGHQKYYSQNNQSECQNICCGEQLSPQGINQQVIEQCKQINQVKSYIFVIVFVSIVMFGVVVGFIWMLKKMLRKDEYQIKNGEDKQNSAIKLSQIPEMQWKQSEGKAQFVGESCSICLLDGLQLETECGHAFHFNCLRNWLFDNQTCPLCISPIKFIKYYCSGCHKNYIVLQIRNSQKSQKFKQQFYNSLCTNCSNYLS